MLRILGLAVQRQVKDFLSLLHFYTFVVRLQRLIYVRNQYRCLLGSNFLPYTMLMH